MSSFFIVAGVSSVALHEVRRVQVRWHTREHRVHRLFKHVCTFSSVLTELIMATLLCRHFFRSAFTTVLLFVVLHKVVTHHFHVVALHHLGVEDGHLADVWHVGHALHHLEELSMSSRIIWILNSVERRFKIFEVASALLLIVCFLSHVIL